MVNAIMERLIEEVRRYENLYNPSLKSYRDAQMSIKVKVKVFIVSINSWREISETVGLDVQECIKCWRKIRDKFVRVNCPNTVKHQASATQDKARRQISYLLVRQTVETGRLQSNLQNAVICLRTLVWQWHGGDSPY